MSHGLELPLLSNHSIRLYVGNTPFTGRVRQVSGLAISLDMEEPVPMVPRVRLELVDEAPTLASLQLQGAITDNHGHEVVVSLERLVIAADQRVVRQLLTAWFPAVPHVESCFHAMMRGFGYELRKAILAGRQQASSPTAASPPVPPERPAMSLPTRSVQLVAEPTAPQRACLHPEAGGSAPPLQPPAVVMSPVTGSRGSLPPQVLRTAHRLLEGSLAANLAVTCQVGGDRASSAFEVGIVYRLSEDQRCAFVGMRTGQLGFGAKVELFIDMHQGDTVRSIRITTSVAWTTQDPDYSDVALVALRLAPANPPDQLRLWHAACQFAIHRAPDRSMVTVIPSRDLLTALG